MAKKMLHRGDVELYYFLDGARKVVRSSTELPSGLTGDVDGLTGEEEERLRSSGPQSRLEGLHTRTANRA